MAQPDTIIERITQGDAPEAPSLERPSRARGRTGLSIALGSLAVAWATRRRSELGLAALGGAIAVRSLAGRMPIAPALQRRAVKSAVRLPVRSAHDYRYSVTVDRPREELFRVLRDFRNMPQFMRHLESVTEVEHGIVRWVARAPEGVELAWETRVSVDRAPEHLAWEAVAGAPFDTSGEIVLAPAPGKRGTEVRVRLRFSAPGGPLGVALATVLGQSPGRQLRTDLHRFKMLMEAGEIATTSGQPRGH